MNIPSLLRRLQETEIEEVIVATNATAGRGSDHVFGPLAWVRWYYVTRPAHGLAADIGYADEMTSSGPLKGDGIYSGKVFQSERRHVSESFESEGPDSR